MTNPGKPSDPPVKTLRDMSGILFVNDKKTNDRQPFMRGQAMVNGQELLMSAWEKDGKIISIAFTDPKTLPPRPQPQVAGAAPSQPGAPSATPPSGTPAYPSPATPPVGSDPFGGIF